MKFLPPMGSSPTKCKTTTRAHVHCFLMSNAPSRPHQPRFFCLISTFCSAPAAPCSGSPIYFRSDLSPDNNMLKTKTRAPKKITANSETPTEPEVNAFWVLTPYAHAQPDWLSTTGNNWGTVNQDTVKDESGVSCIRQLLCPRNSAITSSTNPL